MICKNCNSQIDEGTTFCTNCGAKCDEEPVVQVAAQNSLNESSQNSLNESSQNSLLNPTPHDVPEYVEEEEIQVAFTTQYDNREDFNDDSVYDGETDAPLVPAKNKKKRVVRIIGIVLAVIIAIGGTLAATWRPLVFAVAPEKYMSLLVKNTMDGLLDESAEISENVFGFEFSPQEEFTVGVKVDSHDKYDDVDFDLQVSNYPKDKKLVAEGIIETDEFSTPFEGFWDDEEIGATFSGTDDKFLTVPSKEFGKGFEDSKCVYNNTDRDLRKILSNMDLSYSNIISFTDEKSDNSKALEKVLSKNLQDFFEKGTIGKRESVEHSFDNATVKAKKISFECETDDLFDLVTGTAIDIKRDEKLGAIIGEGVLDELIYEVIEAKKYSDNQKLNIEIIEYKGKIVSISFVWVIDEDNDDSYYEKNKRNFRVTISLGDKKHMLSSIYITFESEYDYRYRDEDDRVGGYKGKWIEEFKFTSNWLTEDEKITISAESSYKDKDTSYRTNKDSEYSYSNTMDFVMDFKKGKWKLDTESSVKWSDGEESSNSESYEGKCSKKNGFSFTVDEEWEEKEWYYTMSFEQWEDHYLQDWLDDIYPSYRSEYLQYVYREVGDYYYNYETYYDWYSDRGEIWDVPDSDFEEWIFYDEYYYDKWDLYDEECYTYRPVDAYCTVDITIKPKATAKISNGKHTNIFKWDEDDFEDLYEEAKYEMRK